MMQRRAVPSVADPGFEAFYLREVVAVTALGTALTGNRDTGAELAHDAMLRAFRDWPTVGAMDRPGAWARRVLINLAHDAHRRTLREQRAHRRVGADDVTRTPAEFDDRFWGAVRALPRRQREAIALRYIDDLPIAGIAEVMQVTAGTVKASLFAARAALAVALGEEEDRDGDDR